MTTETLIILGIVVIAVIALIGKRIINKKRNKDEADPDEIYPLF